MSRRRSNNESLFNIGLAPPVSSTQWNGSAAQCRDSGLIRPCAFFLCFSSLFFSPNLRGRAKKKTKCQKKNLPIVSYRRPKNLRDLLVSTSGSVAGSSGPKADGTFPCETSRCKTCEAVHNLDTVDCKEPYKVRGHFTLYFQLGGVLNQLRETRL